MQREVDDAYVGIHNYRTLLFSNRTSTGMPF